MFTSGCIFTRSTAVAGPGSGGAIYLDGSTLELRDYDFENNRAARAATRARPLSAIGGSFKNNSAQSGAGSGVGDGGALHAKGAGSVAIVGTEFNSNLAVDAGGAL